MQIEQFIETIFPTQKPGMKAGASALSPEDEAKKKAEENEAKWDVIYMGAAVLVTLFVITVVMVRLPISLPLILILTSHTQLGIAYLAGARFDIALSQLTQGKMIPPSPGPEAENVRKNYQQKEL
jgi:farnesyl-diphosphate farnesyltransferase